MRDTIKNREVPHNFVKRLNVFIEIKSIGDAGVDFWLTVNFAGAISYDRPYSPCEYFNSPFVKITHKKFA